MTEENNELLENLKKECDSLGITYTKSATVKSLSDKLKELKADTGELIKEKVLNASEIEKARINKLLLDARKLVRVEVHCNDPKIKDREQCYRSISNKYISLRKVFPFGTPTHLPKMILENIKNERFVSFTKKKGKDGFETTISKEAPTFSIVELKPLSSAELKRIQSRQQAEAAVGED